VLREQAARVRNAVAGVDGVVAPRTSAADQEPTMEIEVDLAAAQRYGLTPGEVRRAAATLLSGIQVGNLFEDQKVFEVVVWGVPEVRHSISGVDELLVDAPNGTQVRLGDVADVRVVPQPSVIQRDAVSRLVDVTASVQGRDIEDVIADVEQQIGEMTFPLEFHAEVVTQAAEQEGAVQRTWLALGAALVAVLLLVQALFDDWRTAGVVMLTVPAALSGGAVVAWVLTLTGDLGSAAATLGLLGVAGLMLRHAVLLVPEVRAGTGTPRARPLLVAIAASVLVLVPFLFAGEYPGAQVVRAMVAVVAGGLVTTALVLLVLLPALLARWAAPVDANARPVDPPGASPLNVDARHLGPDLDVRDAEPRDQAPVGSPATAREALS
jgi:Cu/Ag efflux pump CusA